MKKIIYLVPDTNFFIQCKEPRELDWSTYVDFEEVELLITRPVQAELDNQKGKGSGRVAKRARKASALIRDLLVSESDYIEMRSKAPRVLIRIRQDLKPDILLSNDLCYDERDDQLVGVTSALMKSKPLECVALLTHDTGPMASSKLVGVPFKVIPDDWLLPPETDETDKRTNSLMAELTKYKNAEPKFKISFIHDRVETTTIDCDVKCYKKLTDADIDELLESLKLICPEEVDFGDSKRTQPPPQESYSPIFSGFNSKDVFTPASEEDVAAYQDTIYPGWLEKCSIFFASLHSQLNFRTNWPEICVSVLNIGSRPAIDALTTFSTKGPLLIYPTDSYESLMKDLKEDIQLPSVPKAPQGYWKKVNIFTAMGNLHDLIPKNTFDKEYRGPNLSRLNASKDQNRFYWKPERPNLPQSVIVLECQQWRHQVEKEDFSFFIRTDNETGEYQGVLELRIDSANMTESVEKRVNVSIRVTTAETMEVARKLVKKLGG
ncbi:PIN domain-containing protein [Pseudomonas sp. T1.Ur]|uniref:PIN domain-containing protein n=1 Tax=Pseudomonas sp. T1.Ur TaxID=2928704 RepID=UPI00201D9464|nr:PIN domain-containing protein [Pseudomonas sp. T1.Ur]